MSDRKMASPMDPMDPSDHLIFPMLGNPILSRLCFPLQWNYVINSPSVKYMSNRKMASPMDPILPVGRRSKLRETFVPFPDTLNVHLQPL